MQLSLLFLFGLCLMSGTCLASPSSAELKRIQTQIKQQEMQHKKYQQKALEIANDASSLQKRLIKAANDVQTFEESLSQLEKKQAELKEQQIQINNRLTKRESQMVQLMSGIQKMTLHPKELAIIQPKKPIDNLRATLLIKEAQKPLYENAEQLRLDLTLLQTLESAVAHQAEEVRKASEKLESEKNKMDMLMQQKIILRSQMETESLAAKQKATELAKQAKDIQDLLLKLSVEQEIMENAKRLKPNRNKSEPPALVSGAFAKSKGNLPPPARGKIVQNFNEKTDAGFHTKGITIQTRASAQVTAPFDGKVLFAGPFKSYGNLIILEHDKQYHTLLSGLERLDVAVGQNVLTGEPVGIMPNKAKQKLYIEIRKNGEPVNPKQWLSIK